MQLGCGGLGTNKETGKITLVKDQKYRHSFPAGGSEYKWESAFRNLIGDNPA